MLSFTMFRKQLCVILTLFLFPLPQIYAEGLFLPVPGTMVMQSPSYAPSILKGIKVHTDDPLRVDFILDKGEGTLASDTGVMRSATEIELKAESTKLIKYFLVSLTTPEKDLWVNLSPYEKERIVPESLGQTEMGRDLLAQDYILKQITASLIYPEGTTGREFWKRIYTEAAKRHGNNNVPVNTFNKVWIVPNKAVVYENAKMGTAYVVESSLKVMLEEDYLSTLIHRVGTAPRGRPTQGNEQILEAGRQAQIVRDIVIPELTKEVNQGKNFAQLRQVYNSLILATWYKRKIKDSILARVYADKNKIEGVKVPTLQSGSRQNEMNVGIDQGLNVKLIYERYLQAFKKGAYNYIKEDQDPVTKRSIPKKYFSGGMNMDMAMMTMTDSVGDLHLHEAMIIQVKMDKAMTDVQQTTGQTMLLTKRAIDIVWGGSQKVGGERDYKLIREFLYRGDLNELKEHPLALRAHMIAVWLKARLVDYYMEVQHGSLVQDQLLRDVEEVVQAYLISLSAGTNTAAQNEAISQLSSWGMPRFQIEIILHWVQDVFNGLAVYPISLHHWAATTDARQAQDAAYRFGSILGFNSNQVSELVDYLLGMSEKYFDLDQDDQRKEQRKFDAVWLAVKYKWSQGSFVDLVQQDKLGRLKEEGGVILREALAKEWKYADAKEKPYTNTEVDAMGNDALILWDRWQLIKGRTRKGSLEQIRDLEKKISLVPTTLRDRDTPFDWETFSGSNSGGIDHAQSADAKVAADQFTKNIVLDTKDQVKGTTDDAMTHENTVNQFRRSLLIAGVIGAIGMPVVAGEIEEQSVASKEASIKKAKDMLIAQGVLDKSFSDVVVRLGDASRVGDKDGIILNEKDYEELNENDLFVRAMVQLAYYGSRWEIGRGYEREKNLSLVQEEYRALLSQAGALSILFALRIRGKVFTQENRKNRYLRRAYELLLMGKMGLEGFSSYRPEASHIFEKGQERRDNVVLISLYHSGFNKRVVVVVNIDESTVEFRPSSQIDSAQLSVIEPKRGGIDFNDDKMDLELMNSAGSIKFNVDSAQLKAFQDVQGLMPVIIRMQVVPTGQAGENMIKLFLGVPLENMPLQSKT